MGIYDVPSQRLISEVAKELKNSFAIPEWTVYVKTGCHKERTPNSPDWFYMRSASILYQTYKNGSSGTGRLRSYYGGRKNRGVKPEIKRKASGKVIRTCIQNLEKAGFLKKEKIGRSVSGKGEKLLFTKAREIEIIFSGEMAKKQADKDQRLENAKASREKAMAQKHAEQKKEEAPKEQAPQKDAEKGGKHERRPEGKKA